MVLVPTPLHVIEGFTRRIWKDLSIDKVGMVEKGVFLVRFKSQQDRIKACGMSGIMFDRKPFVVKPWRPSMSYSKDSLSSIPIWVRFSGLDVMYWGEKSLTKIASMLGTFMKVDGATGNKDQMMMYARVLVYINVSKGFHEEVCYENEHNELITQKVEYDWQPIWCNKCQQMGHIDMNYRKGKPELTQTRPKPKPAVDDEGFQVVQQKTRKVYTYS